MEKKIGDGKSSNNTKNCAKQVTPVLCICLIKLRVYA